MRHQILLDTDTLSLLRRGDESVTQDAADYLISFDRLAFTDLTWYEVLRGYRVIGAHRQLEAFEGSCRSCDILSLDRSALDCAANIYASLHQRGELIGEVDILIAGIALVNGMGVATRNVTHFSRVDGLHIEIWAD